MSGNGGMGGMPGVKKNKDMNRYKKGGAVGIASMGRQRPAKLIKMNSGGSVPMSNSPSDGGMSRGTGAATKGKKFEGTY